MPTPVGPAAPDPDDPDLWAEWYGDDDDEDDDGYTGGSSYGWPLRILALLVLVGVAALLVLAA